MPGGRTVSGLIDNAQTGCQHTGVAKGGRPISVLVVDDHRTFAEALAVAFGLEKDLDVRVASTAAEAVAAAERMQPDVVLMDVEMPGVDGIEAIRRLAETHPRARVLVLSAHDEDLLRARALEAGAVGYVSKAAPIRSLPEIVRKARRGEPIIEREEVERLQRVLRHRRREEATQRQRVGRLTPRQTEILQLMADGVPMDEIAARLNLTRATLRTHVQNILTRLSVHTKVEALAVAIRHGKVSVGS